MTEASVLALAAVLAALLAAVVAIAAVGRLDIPPRVPGDRRKNRR